LTGEGRWGIIIYIIYFLSHNEADNMSKIRGITPGLQKSPNTRGFAAVFSAANTVIIRLKMGRA